LSDCILEEESRRSLETFSLHSLKLISTLRKLSLQPSKTPALLKRRRQRKDSSD